jgi:nucleoside-diphosphate-sugar epimerase
VTILITGSTGYIGSKLTQKLAAEGKKISLLLRKDPTIESFNATSIDIKKGDITDIESLREAMKDVDQVYHLAAYARAYSKDPSIYFQVNVEGTRNVLQAALEKGVKKVVYTSTAAVLGPSGDGAQNENSPKLAPYFNPYEISKGESEKVVGEYFQKGLNTVIVNPARVYGPGLESGSNPFTKIISLYMEGKWKAIPGDGNQIGSYCYIDDIVDGHMKAMEKGRAGERYLLGGDNVTLNNFFNTIREASGKDYPLRHVPFGLLVAGSWLEVAKAKLFGGEPRISPDWAAKYKLHWKLDSSKAQRELGYNIRPLREGIQSTVDWLLSRKKT